MATVPTLGRQNVKSIPVTATDAHERRKDFLSETEIAALLDASRMGAMESAIISSFSRCFVTVCASARRSAFPP